MRHIAQFSLVTLALFAAAIPAFSQSKIDCTGKQPNNSCKEVWQAGYKFVLIRDGNIGIAASVTSYVDKNTFSRTIGIVNLGTDLVDVDPEKLSATLSDGAVASSANPDVILAKRKRNATILNLLAGFADVAINGNQPAIVTESNGSGFITYSQDMASIRESGRQEDIDSKFNSFTSQSLRHTTLAKNGVIYGAVYFARPKKSNKHAELDSTQITIGATTYVF